MRKHRVPVIVFSAQSEEGAYSTLKALALGAFDFVAKPTDAASGHLEQIAAELAHKIKVAKRAGAPKDYPRPSCRIGTAALRKNRARSALRPESRRRHRNFHRRPQRAAISVLADSGGFSGLPSRGAAHARRFYGNVRAAPRRMLRAGSEGGAIRRLVARRARAHLPGQSPHDGSPHAAGRHGDSRRTAAPVNGHRPSVDVLFHSVAQEFALTAVGVLMTGMGEDGAEGLGAIKAAGGITIAQSEETCVVSGMPRAAISKGYANRVIAVEQIGEFPGSSMEANAWRLEKSDESEKIAPIEMTGRQVERSERTPVSSPRS